MVPTVAANEPTPKRDRPHWLRFGLRSLLLALVVFGIPLGILSADLREYERQKDAYHLLDTEIYTNDVGVFPWYTRWLHNFLGHEDSFDLGFLILNNEALVDDAKLKAIGNFKNLRQLWLNGELKITDAGLERLNGLKQLKELSLGNAPVSAAAVEKLRRSLPLCDVSWNPDVPEEPNPRTADQNGIEFDR
jgi:hypothetical protein